MLTIEKMYQQISERLNAKRNNLQKRQESFKIMVSNEMHSGCFEQNAISDLITMTQLKHEIEELEMQQTLLKVGVDNNK